RLGSSPSSSRSWPNGSASRNRPAGARMILVHYYAAQTLDGFIAEPDDTLDWLLSYEGHFEGADSDEGQAGYDSFYEGIGALVMGSTTYEWVLVHGGEWPYAGRPSWVLSARELERPQGEEV